MLHPFVAISPILPCGWARELFNQSWSCRQHDGTADDSPEGHCGAAVIPSCHGPFLSAHWLCKQCSGAICRCVTSIRFPFNAYLQEHCRICPKLHRITYFLFYSTGWLYDITGNYDVPFYVTGGVQCLAAVFFLLVFISARRNTHAAPGSDEAANDKCKDEDIDTGC